MNIIKNIIVAFSLYSQIPMPRFEWKEEDMKHNIVFLPWIGAVIGLICMGLNYLYSFVELPLICRICLYSLVPLVVTGGFHMDGYMDVQDALKSYKSKEEKLEILKDPHIGAFAVIRVLIYALVWTAALAVICERESGKSTAAFCLIFFISRAVSSLSSLKLKHAKRNGMLQMETQKAGNTDFVLCLLQLIAVFAFTAYMEPVYAMALALAALLHFFYYRNMCYKQFGGITGDTAGFDIVSLEECLLVVIAVLEFII